MKKLIGVALLAGMAWGVSGGLAVAEEDKDIAYVRANIGKLADAHFPDNTGLEWTVLKISKIPQGVDVTAESSPTDVGYNPVRMWIAMDGTPRVVACYVQNVVTGKWDLTGYDPSVAPPKHLGAKVKKKDPRSYR